VSYQEGVVTGAVFDLLEAAVPVPVLGLIFSCVFFFGYEKLNKSSFSMFLYLEL
jgi:hypothetical protein